MRGFGVQLTIDIFVDQKKKQLTYLMEHHHQVVGAMRCLIYSHVNCLDFRKYASGPAPTNDFLKVPTKVRYTTRK